MTLGILRSPSPVGFMPLIRPGDLVFTAIVLHHRMVKGSTVSEAVAAVRGRDAGHARSLFGHDIGQIATRVFGSMAIAGRVLATNTLFGAYSRGMSVEMACAWARQLLSEKTSNSSRFLGAGMGPLPLTSHRLRSCNACIESDFSSQGFAAWRVLHQVASIDRCPEHGLPLVEEGAPTGGGHRRLWTLRLPGEGRGLTNLERIECIPVSDGYAGYLKLWPGVFAGDIPAVEPARWIALMNRIVTRYGGLEGATGALEAEIQHSWELPIPEIASRLLLAGGTSFVRQELALNTRPKDIARRMVIYTTAERLDLIPGTNEPPTQTELTLNHSLTTGSNNDTSAHIGPWEELSRLAINRGLPLAISRVLITDVSSSRAAYIVEMSKEMVRVFVATLPIRLLDDLSQLHNWSDTSWLKMEIARREGRIRNTNEDHPSRLNNSC